ncbi:MAG TPA: DUF1801 domain-containing protein [Gemmatimonadales bacterium]|nr:DUF1801 domain-containing protein [Gemmatimonadales bacterium]
MATRASPVARYIAALDPGLRPALRHLRKELRASLPGAEEVISYGVPAYKVDGRLVIGFGATRSRCSLYVMSPAVMRTYARALKRFELTKGAVHFPADRGIPLTLLRRLVKARLAENAGRRP